MLRAPLVVVNTAIGLIVSLPRLASLAREHAALRARLTEDQRELTQLREALRRAQRLETLAALDPPSPRAVIATVVGRSTLPTQHTALLNRGRRHGLRLEGVVLSDTGIVGRVTELDEGTALVTLLTDPSSRIAGLIERSRETGLLIGRGLRSCELLYLTVESDVVPGDRVLTAGLGGAIPKGLLLGTVVQVHPDPHTGSALATVRPSARLGQLEDVLCLLPKSSD